MGDAAHASTPHQGAGAGQAIEDAFILSSLLGDELTKTTTDIPTAFKVYDAIRRPRSQKVVSTSRAAGLTYAFQGAAGGDIGKIREELMHRFQWIWAEDMERQAEQAKSLLRREKQIGEQTSGRRRPYIWKGVIEDMVSKVLSFCRGLFWRVN